MSTLSTCHEKIFALKKEIELKEKEIYKFYEQAVKENIKLGAGSIVTDRTNLVKYKVSETIRLNYSQKKLTLQHVAARELDNGLTQWLYFTESDISHKKIIVLKEEEVFLERVDWHLV